MTFVQMVFHAASRGFSSVIIPRDIWDSHMGSNRLDQTLIYVTQGISILAIKEKQKRKLRRKVVNNA